MDASVALVPKLLRILKARGLPAADGDTNLDFGPVESALGCPLPADYKELLTALPPGVYIAWGDDPFSLYTNPDEVLKGAKQLHETYKDSKPGVETDWSKPNCFVPFGRSSSAFYIGWLKRKNDSTKECWDIVVVDAENNLEVRDCVGNKLQMPLVELLYRMVVGAVTPELWKRYAQTSAAYVWFADCETQRTKRWARDGSEDITASENGRIVVFGRPVAYLGGADPREDDDEEDSDEEESDGESDKEEEDEGDYEDDSDDDGNKGGKKEKRKTNLPSTLAFQGCSEEDFNGVGVYNLTHPMDLAQELRENRVKDAPQSVARVDVSLPPNSISAPQLQLVEDGRLRETLAKVIVPGRRVAVGQAWSAFIGADNGHLALVEPENGFLWWCTEANQMLEDGEKYTQVALSDRRGIALTSEGRILVFSTQPKLSFSWKAFDKLPDFRSFKIAKVDTSGISSAVLLANGRVLYWGHLQSCHASRPKNTRDGDPFIIPGINDIVDLSVDNYKLCLLQSDGEVLVGSQKGGLQSFGKTMPPIVSVFGADSHSLFLANDGSVYGLGDRKDGQLPVPTTQEMVDEYGQSKKRFAEKAATYEQELKRFRSQVLEHSRTCPKSKPPPYPDAEDTWKPQRDKDFFVNVFLVHKVNGIQHTKGNCGGPALPDHLSRGPVPPGDPCEPPKDEFKEPKVLAVGHKQREAAELYASLAAPNAWNAPGGPYGLPPGSYEPVIACRGEYGSSVFLHLDGTLSACGQGTSHCNGLAPPKDRPDDVPVVSFYEYSCGNLLCYQNLHMPTAVVGVDASFVAVATGRGGALAVQDDGTVWGCGVSVGTKKGTKKFEVLKVREG